MVIRASESMALVAMVVLLSGCPQILDSILNPGSPTGVSASEGRGRGVHISWSEPSLAEDDERVVESYDVYRDGDFIGTTWMTSFEDDEPRPAERHTYTVSTNFEDGSFSAESSGSPGWYVPAETLPLLSGPSGRHLTPGKAVTSDGWFETLVVKGWTYHFESSEQTTVWVCREERPWSQDLLGTSKSLTWKSDRTERVWLRVASARALLGWYE